MVERLALGTAQFGLRYGVANTEGRVLENDAKMIVQQASRSGMDTLDTAIAYGDSEERLGRIGIHKWRVVTKLPAVPEQCDDIGRWVDETVRGSLQRLQIPRLYGLLLHSPQQLLTNCGEALYAALVELKDDGLAERIGISVYDPSELDSIWADFSFDLVQAPFNVVDRRLKTSGWLRRLNDNGVEVHTRSAFLQGLLAMPAARRPARFQRWQTLWDAWDEWLSYSRLTPVQACVGFCLAEPDIDRVVVGVDRPHHLDEIVAAASATVAAPPNLASEDRDLIEPSRWNSL